MIIDAKMNFTGLTNGVPTAQALPTGTTTS